MTPQEAKEQYGATHYTTMKDGVTPQMYYKRERIPVNDNTIYECWVYMSYCNLWMGSSITQEGREDMLKPII